MFAGMSLTRHIFRTFFVVDQYLLNIYFLKPFILHKTVLISLMTKLVPIASIRNAYCLQSLINGYPDKWNCFKDKYSEE